MNFSSREKEIAACKELGEFFGFPQTAVDAYKKYLSLGYDRYEKRKSVSIDQEDLPSDVRKQNFMAFAQFRLSKDHWREELETAKRWAEEIKKVDPALYKREVASYRRRLTPRQNSE